MRSAGSLTHVCLTVGVGLFLAGCAFFPQWTIKTKKVFVTCHGAPEEKGAVHLYKPDAGGESSTILYEHAGLQRLRNWTGGLYLLVQQAGQLDILGREQPYELEARLSRFSGPRSINFPDYKTGVLTDRLPPESSAPNSVHILAMTEFLYEGAPVPKVVKSFAVSGTVAGITNTEHHVSHSPKDRVYVALGEKGGTTRVAVLNSYERTFVTEVDIGCSARFVAADGDDEVFILCERGEAVVLDGTTVKERIPLPGPVETNGPGQEAMYAYGKAKGELYVIIAKQRIVRINTATNKPDTTFDLSGGGPIGTVGYDGHDNRLYVARADSEAPMQANGTVTIHRRDGTRIGTFEVGAVPVDIDFGWYEVKK